MTTNLIEHNPMLKKPLLALLAESEQHPHVNRAELEARAFETWSDEYTQSPAVCVDILVRNEAMTEQLYVDGVLYSGTLEDLQTDESVTENTLAESRLSIADAGRELLAAYTPEATLQALLNEKPHYCNIFEIILCACSTPSGCSRIDLEHTIDAQPQLQPEPTTQRTTVYPQYFIDALESAGGIIWQGSWFTTEVGEAIITA